MNTIWQGCYDESWKGLICDGAFAHPAKFSRGLIRRIYTHLLANGLVAAGDTIVDPFGGVALGALDAVANNLHWIGCELEPKFHALGNANINLWLNRLGAHTSGSAILHRADSRKLAEVLRIGAEAVATSPPYSGNDRTRARDEKKGFRHGHGCFRGSEGAYGQTEGQLGTLPSGDLSAVVSSPPYEGTRQDGAGINLEDGKGFSSYSDGATDQWHTQRDQANLGNQRGENFWQASRKIVEQCHMILRHGGVAVFVTKDFVKKRFRAAFSADWLRLCEACGFRLLDWIKASLVNRTSEDSLFGGVEEKKVERKSFFRRLAEKNGSPRIDEEDILILQKP